MARIGEKAAARRSQQRRQQRSADVAAHLFRQKVTRPGLSRPPVGLPSSISSQYGTAANCPERFTGGSDRSTRNIRPKVLQPGRVEQAIPAAPRPGQPAEV